MHQVFDVAIIGGGINGCGCAADAAQRGLSVVLLEQGDLASQTSSSSTKLIHGGLRYLEQYEFSLVKKAIEERQRLLNLAPHLVKPLPFILPYQKTERSFWLIRLGLFLYDHMSSKNHLPRCQSVYRKSKKNNYFTPLVAALKRGFKFYDASTEDARLTLVNALQAKYQGASILPHSKVIAVTTLKNLWHLTIQPKQGANYTIRAKSLINAGGPWVKQIAQLTQTPLRHSLTLVKGSHIIVPKLYEGEQAYMLQHSDKRVIFVIPYHGYSMVGTTELPYSENLEQLHISEEEMSYLTQIVNHYFKNSINNKDILYSWSGIRPLLADQNKDAHSLSRDYQYEYFDHPAPIITLLGGKITTYRQLAEEVINLLQPLFPEMRSSDTKNTTLPGATLGTMNFADYIVYAKKKYHWLDSDLLSRYLNTYGTHTEIFLSSCTTVESLGKNYGASLYQVEVDYLILEEWAQSVDDILYRRTKLGLSMDETSKQELDFYIQSLIVHPALTEPEFH